VSVSVCLSACLSVYLKTTRSNFTKFSVRVIRAVALSSFDNNSHVLPVL